MNQTFNYGSGHLTSGIALAIANGKTKGVLSADAISRVNQSQKKSSGYHCFKKNGVWYQHRFRDTCEYRYFG